MVKILNNISALLILLSAGFLGFTANNFYNGLASEKQQSEIKIAITAMGTELNLMNKKVDGLFENDNEMSLAFGLPAVSNDLREVGIGGHQHRPYEELIFMLPEERVLEGIKASFNKLKRQKQLQDSRIEEMEEYFISQKNFFDRSPSIYPSNGGITSTFGLRLHPIHKKIHFHMGMDFANSLNTPVYATGKGVIKIGLSESYGNYLMIDHSNGYKTMYAHLNGTAVPNGKLVKRGDLIGFMGSTGLSTGSHLHYEVRLHNRPLNPNDYILPTNYIVN